MAFEGDYRVYRDVLAVGIRILRPRAEVETADLEALEEVECFRPQVLICSRSDEVDLSGWPAWIELPMDPTRPSKVSIGGRYSERSNPTLRELVGIIDEVARLVQRNTATA